MQGEVVKADADTFQRLIDIRGSNVRLVCLSACHSENFGRLFAMNGGMSISGLSTCPCAFSYV